MKNILPSRVGVFYASTLLCIFTLFGCQEKVQKGSNLQLQSKAEALKDKDPAISREIVNTLWRLSKAGKPKVMYLVPADFTALEEAKKVKFGDILILWNSEAREYFDIKNKEYSVFEFLPNDNIFRPFFNDMFKEYRIKEGFVEDELFILVSELKVLKGTGKHENKKLLWEKWLGDNVMSATVNM